MLSGDIQKKIRVLIVDDSAIVRRIFREQLEQDENIQVVGVAPNPYVARDKIVYLQPDVVTLDVEMPRMDGLSFLEKLMKYYPIPVIVISSYTQRSCQKAMQALDLGAVAVLGKPDRSFSVGQLGQELIACVKEAASINIRKKRKVLAEDPDKGYIQKATRSSIVNWKHIFAIGSSTGGTDALKQIFVSLPADFPAVLVVQHMPIKFTKLLADRLNDVCPMNVVEATNGDLIQPGNIYIAPGNQHMLVKKMGKEYRIRLRGGGMVCFHRPSVEVLFRSVANNVGANSTGIILTGMGRDGADGLLEMKNAGAFTIAQNEESCIVYGMPKEAVKLGAAKKILPLSKISHEIIQIAQQSPI